jgi:hypothetical protein
MKTFGVKPSARQQLLKSSAKREVLKTMQNENMALNPSVLCNSLNYYRTNRSCTLQNFLWAFSKKKGYHKFDHKTLLRRFKCCFYLPFLNPRGHLLKNPKGESLFSLFLCEV